MSQRKVVTIHQPNFFPWLGYFNKISRADLFIVLDNVQFPKKGGTWSNRVRLIVNGQSAWVTMPIVRAYHGSRRINEMQINNTSPWRSKLLKTIQMNYRRAPYFETVFPLLEELVNNPTDNLAVYNLATLHCLVATLQLDQPQLVRGSSLDVEGNATDLLISMVQAVSGTAYLCGDGAMDYQEDEKFAEAGIELIYQNFKHPVYDQVNTQEFVPGLSIIDMLLNCGFDNTRQLIRSEGEANYDRNPA